MTEIWNLSTLCRCCHSDGSFKSLNFPYQSINGVEIYEIMLQDTLGIRISQPQVEASYTICDDCIKRLKDVSAFKEQVLACEKKFKIYCTNEQFLNGNVESVKTEVESNVTGNDDVTDVYYDNEDVQHVDNSLPIDKNPDIAFIKEEITIEVDIKHPIEQIKEIENVPANDSIKTEVEQLDEKKKTGSIKKRIRRKKSLEQLKHDALYNRNYLKLRRKLYDTFVVQVKTKNGITYSCKTCGGSYQTKKDLFKHISLQHHSRYKCEQCGKHFKYGSHLKRHTRIHEQNSRYDCRHCGKNFTCKASLKTHENIHTKQLVYQCDICQKELRYKNTLRKHILQMHSTENKELLCDICGWSFKQRSNLEAHIRTVHLKQRPYACSICGKTYTAKKHVKNHIKTAHSGNPKPHQCDFCSKRFACPKSYKLHRLTHDNHFACRYCSLVFDNKKDCDIHTKTHTQEHYLNSPYGCHLCGKVLMTKFTLNRHIELHDGIKRFSCNLCGVKFTQKCLLQRHNRRKHDPNVKTEKTKCDLCKKLVRDIDKHMDTHDTDKRKYYCDICGKNYSENNALTRHKNQKHFGVSYDCDVCGKKYIKKKSLETHKYKVHKIKKEVVESTGTSEDIEMTNVT